MNEDTIGFERSTLGPAKYPFRWWVFIHLSEGEARTQGPRKGVPGNGFYFARGGVARSADSALNEIECARRQAGVEWKAWQHQPSHLLAPSGRLVPVDEVPLGLER